MSTTLSSSCLPGQSLRVCVHPGPSCCTSKMEDSYMAAVRSETQQKMRSYSFELKYLIAGHTKAYQGEGEKLPAGSSAASFHTFYTCFQTFQSIFRWSEGVLFDY